MKKFKGTTRHLTTAQSRQTKFNMEMEGASQFNTENANSKSTCNSNIYMWSNFLKIKVS